MNLKRIIEIYWLFCDMTFTEEYWMQVLFINFVTSIWKVLRFWPVSTTCIKIAPDSGHTTPDHWGQNGASFCDWVATQAARKADFLITCAVFSVEGCLR